MNVTAPIFVVGLNKSGTSLLYLLLAQHENLSGLASLDRRRGKQEATKPYLPWGLDSFFRRRKRQGVANLYLQDYGLVEGQKIDGLPVKLVTSVAPYLFANPNYIDCYRLTEADVEPGDREAIVSAWRSAMVKPNCRLIEKSPPNMVRTRYLQALFPDATFILIVRDPYANISANAKRRKRWGSVVDQALHWTNAHRIVLDDLQHLRRAKIVHYEDLINDAEGSLGAICDFCDLPWDKAMLDVIPIEAGMNEELIAALSPDEIESITEVLNAQILSMLGYGKRQSGHTFLN